ncbi:MAG: carbamoyltransferase HypF [Chloroflexi bacterium]|nr:carbamoyltransferase HypF [Chloroflexota bacterium]
MASQRLTYRIHVDGIVQGVGFRPFVYRLAREYGLTGWVRNSSLGVDIEVTGPAEHLEAFLHALRAQAPPLADIQSLTWTPIPTPPTPPDTFLILPSEDQGGFTLVSPDVATCPQCLAEVLDPHDRRYRYPFTNCTNCGPRFSIIRKLPYDRPNTTMADFPMCAQCLAEYHDPLNRRFHAQPNACPKCGPHVELEVKPGWERHIKGPEEDDIARVARLLEAGAIVAIKGLGGFHLACDATNARAVRTLRERKPRPHKPLALMMRDLDMVRAYCHLSPEAEALLASPAAPILLLPAKPHTDLAPHIAPGQRHIGVMLPYTPLHHILLRDVNRPLVMTSGNRSNEPIARTHEEARESLDPIVDAYLWHNRPIHNRVDDSVWMLTPTGPMPIRRSRGYAPYPIRIHREAKTPVLATGSFMKNTFCLVSGRWAFLSQHIGEMEYAKTWRFFTESLQRFMDLFGIRPQVVAHDMHPDFAQLAHDLLAEIPTLGHVRWIPVQHHHAHIAACLADNQIAGPVIGLALDGTGYGPDGTIWGGEILLADERSYRRMARLTPFPLPGGDEAVRHPWRIALILAEQALGDIPSVLLDHLNIPSQMARIVIQQSDKGLNAPLTSSCGRLFDGVAALLGVRHHITYEGQAAIELETLAAQATDETRYPVSTQRRTSLWEIDWHPVVRAVWEDLQRGIPPERIARRFHNTLVHALSALVFHIAEETGVREVALSGGCAQNLLLQEGLIAQLEKMGLTVYTHHRVPANDGGLSLGQAVVALAQVSDME